MNPGVPILLVEDDAVDVKNIRRAFGRNRLINPLYVVSNGEEALAFLGNRPPYEDPQEAPRPGLILLDLNMPVMSGLEFLEIYRDDPDLKSIPTVVLTTSDLERDRLRSYSIGVAGYIVKPIRFDAFVELVHTFDLYWSICRLP